MTNKNPFEIRAEVLQLAKEYMDTQHKLNLDYAQTLRNLGKAQRDEYLASFKPYTFDELMEKAKEMYGFVSKKD